MKQYTSPQLTEYGDIADLTAFFGSSMVGDVLVDTNGDVVQNGTGSLDGCPTADPTSSGSCQINPNP